MPKALIVKLGAIGDVLMVVPAAYALHRGGCQVEWLCGENVAPLLECYPWISTIRVDERALLRGNTAQRVQALAAIWRTLAGRRYALCATLYYDRRYSALSLPVRAERRIRLRAGVREQALLPGRHHTDEYARILLARKDTQWPVTLAPVRPERLPEAPLKRREGQPRILLAPAGARNLMRDDALRRWPAENYAELAEKLLYRGMDVVLIGGADDAWVHPVFSGLGATDLIGKLTLPQTLALMDASEVLVTHDTGPLHMAGVTRVGIVAIFGPTDPRGRLPQRANTVALWGGEGFACRPCYDGRDFAPCSENGCMRQVTPERVMREIEALLEQRRPGAARPPRVVTPESTVSAGLHE